jgi:pyruvate dehydrogenase E1 component beta subunit
MTVDDARSAAVMRNREAINDALRVALTVDDRVFLLGEDITDPSGGVFGVTRGLSTEFGPERVRATPISEQAIVGAAIGAALRGMRPVAEVMIMSFLPVCLDQVVNHAAKLRYMSGGQTNVPLTIRCSAGAGMNFGAQHSDMLESWLCHVAGLRVVIPSNPADAKGLLLSCIFDDDPCIFVEQTLSYSRRADVPAGDYRVPLGKASIARPGADITLVAYGRQVNDALRAADTLHDDGIEAEVIDVRCLAPLDTQAIVGSVSKSRRAVVVHEAPRTCGFGAELAATITEATFSTLLAPVLRVTGRDVPVPYASELERAYLPSPDAIVDAAHRVMAWS